MGFVNLNFNTILFLSELRNKRIRYNLKVAVKRRDRDKLPHAVDAFKAARLSDDDMDLAKAEQILREFKASDGECISLAN